MARYSLAYSAWITRLNEVDILLHSAAKLEKEDPIKNEAIIRALCRGALVLLCSHLEAFVRDLGDITLQKIYEKKVDRSRLSPRFFFNISRPIIGEIKDTQDQTKVAEKVFEFLSTESDYWKVNGPFETALSSEDFSAGFSNPAFRKIRKFFNRFGCEDFQDLMKRQLRRKYLASVNGVTQLVGIRNQIAHGDAGASMTPSEVSDLERLIRQFCQAVDSVFGSWCRIHLCSIR